MAKTPVQTAAAQPIKQTNTTQNRDNANQGPATQEQANAGSMFGELGEGNEQHSPAEPQENANTPTAQAAALKRIAESGETLEAIAGNGARKTFEELEDEDLDRKGITDPEQRAKMKAESAERHAGFGELIKPDERANDIVDSQVEYLANMPDFVDDAALEKEVREFLAKDGKEHTDAEVASIVALNKAVRGRGEEIFRRMENRNMPTGIRALERVEMPDEKLMNDIFAYAVQFAKEAGNEEIDKKYQEALTKRLQLRNMQRDPVKDKPIETLSEREKREVALQVANETYGKREIKRDHGLIAEEDQEVYKKLLMLPGDIQNWIKNKLDLDDVEDKLPQLGTEGVRLLMAFKDLQQAVANNADNKEAQMRLGDAKQGLENIKPEKKEEAIASAVMHTMNKDISWRKLLQLFAMLGLVIFGSAAGELTQDLEKGLAAA